MLQLAGRAIAAAGAALAATAAALRDDLLQRDKLASEFLQARPRKLTEASGSLVATASTPCDCAARRSRQTHVHDADTAPGVLDTALDVVLGIARHIVLHGPTEIGAEAAGLLALSPTALTSETAQQQFAQSAVRAALLGADASLLLGSIKASAKPVLGFGIVCRPCNELGTEGVLGFYQPYLLRVGGAEAQTTGQIVICSNRNSGVSQIAQTVTHELIHAYDQTREHSHLQDCEYRGCTEARAYNLTIRALPWERRSKVRMGAHRSCERACAMKQNEVERALGRCMEDRAPFTGPSDRLPDMPNIW